MTEQHTISMTDRRYRVVEYLGWSYVEGPEKLVDGPWRYRWEAEEWAGQMEGAGAIGERSQKEE